jgi:hypothetical protein
MAEEEWAGNLPLTRWLIRLVVLVIWPFSRVEFLLLRSVPAFALNMHITAVRPGYVARHQFD